MDLREVWKLEESCCPNKYMGSERVRGYADGNRVIVDSVPRAVCIARIMAHVWLHP